jgi:hypothetical protein
MAKKRCQTNCYVILIAKNIFAAFLCFVLAFSISWKLDKTNKIKILFGSHVEKE